MELAHMLFKDETKFIKMIQQGDEEAWRHLIGHYSGVVKAATFRYDLSSEDREDILQDVFFRLIKSISNYNLNKSLLTTFLGTITKRVCIDRFRKHHIKVKEVPILGELSASSSGEDNGKSQMIESLRAAIKKLPRKQRLVIYLFYFNKCSYERIAEIMNTDFDWVKNTLHRTKKNLELLFKNNF